MAEINPRTQLLTGHTNQPDIVTGDQAQHVKVDATAGQFKLVLDPDDANQTTADIAFNAAPAAVKAAIVAEDVVEADEVDVTGGPGNAGGTTPYVVTFHDVEGYGEFPPLEAAAGTTPLSGGAATVTITVVEGRVIAEHDTTVITDPTDPLAVQYPDPNSPADGRNANPLLRPPSPAEEFGDN